MSEIRVKEEYHGRGIGKELLILVETKAIDMRLDTIYLHAEANNLEPVRFYKATGYCEERIQMRKEILRLSQDADSE